MLQWRCPNIRFLKLHPLSVVVAVADAAIRSDGGVVRVRGWLLLVSGDRVEGLIGVWLYGGEVLEETRKENETRAENAECYFGHSGRRCELGENGY